MELAFAMYFLVFFVTNALCWTGWLDREATGKVSNVVG